MDQKPQTSGERHIDHLLHNLDPSSERYAILETAKKFKSSWVELGERLLKVNSRGLYREWGFDSFDDYCSKEIRIRKPTAEKLTLAYRFMEKEEPELLQQKEKIKPLPDYRSMDLLRQAKEEKGFTDEEYANLRKAVVEEEKSHPTALKQFKEIADEKEPPSEKTVIHVKLALAAARRLSKLLQELETVPQAHRQHVEELLADLQERADTAKIREVQV